LKLHVINGYIQSIYLVEYAHGLLLLDGCSRADVQTIKAYITENLNRSFSDLKLVVVTHMHPDHAGAAHRLRKLTGCKIASANVEGHWYSGIDGLIMHWTDMALTQWVAKKKKQPRKNIWYPAKLKADVLLNDGDLLPEFKEWQALSTQGHTDRDLSLLHINSKQIYVADLIVIVKGKLTAPFPVFYPRRYRESLTKLKKIQPKYLLLAHQKSVEVKGEDFDKLITKAPTKPLTHWRMVKHKLRTIWQN